MFPLYLEQHYQFQIAINTHHRGLELDHSNLVHDPAMLYAWFVVITPTSSPGWLVTRYSAPSFFTYKLHVVIGLDAET